MRKNLRIAGLVAAMTVAPSLWALDEKNAELGSPSPGAQIYGTVKSVNPPVSEIMMIDTAGELQTYTIGSAVTVTDGQNKVSLSDIKPGDAITIVQDGGQVTDVVVAQAQPLQQP